MPTCKLCLEKPAVRRSHIIPEFMYKHHYDDKHRMFLLSTAHQEPNRRISKGVYERLLCKDCETRLSVYEQYCHDLINVSCPCTLDRNAHLELHGVNYHKLKLFQMLMLWRAGASQRPEFRKVELGPHQEKLRQMILSNDPGEAWQYPCMMILILDDGFDPQGFTIMPLARKLHGHSIYTFIAGGLAWLYCVSSHRPPEMFEKMALKENGDINIYKKPASYFLKPMAQRLGDAGKLKGAKT